MSRCRKEQFKYYGYAQDTEEIIWNGEVELT